MARKSRAQAQSEGEKYQVVPEYVGQLTKDTIVTHQELEDLGYDVDAVVKDGLFKKLSASAARQAEEEGRQEQGGQPPEQAPA